MKKREFLALSGAAPLMLAGCGSSSGGSAQLRLVNVSVGYPTLDLTVSATSTSTATTVAAAVAYGTASAFAGVGASSQSTTLVDATATPSVNVSTQTRTLLKDTTYSLIAYGYKDGAKSVLITESQTAPAVGFASISVLNTAIDVGPVDVYFTTGPDISTASPVATRVTAVSASAFNAVSKGTYTITIVAYGTGASGNPDIRLQVSGVTLADQQIATLIIAPGDGGVLAHAVLLNQGGDAVNFRNTQARVRVVAATGNGGTVAVAGLLASTAVVPSYTTYRQIAAGALPAVTVDGATISYPAGATALAAGADYTILIYGDHAAAQINLITDVNRLPSSSSAAKVSLLHALFNNSALLTLNLNSTAADTDVAYGTASLYTEVTPKVTSSTQLLEVTTGAFDTVLSKQVGMDVGGVYTLFVVGDDSLPLHAGVLSYLAPSR